MWRQDPVLFAQKVLKIDPWSKPIQILRDLSKPNALVAVKACHSSSKCLAADELVTLFDGTTEYARDLVGRKFHVLVPTEDGPIKAEANAGWNLVEQTLALNTKSGRRVVRNAGHPFKVAQRPQLNTVKDKLESVGWLPLSEIRKDDFVAASTRIMTEHSGVDMDYDELLILAYFTGSVGHSLIGTLPILASERCHKEMAELIRKVGGFMTVNPTGINRSFPYDIGPILEQDDSGAVLSILHKHGVLGMDFENRRIPNIVFSLSPVKKAYFLSRLYSFGGYVDSDSRFSVHFRSISQNLVRDVQRLLLHIDIRGEIVQSVDNAWEVKIGKIPEVARFLRLVGIYGREDECMTALRSTVEWEVREIEQKQYKVPTMLPPLYPDLFWDEVTGVELAGVRPTVAIEVPGFNTYLDLFWEHNTHTAAAATLWFTCTGGVTITTAPSDDQVERLLWGDVHRIYERVSEQLGGLLNLKDYKISPSSYAFGRSTDQGVRFQGHHDKGGGALIIIDEAPGVKEDIHESIEGIRAGGDVRILMLGNPVFGGNTFEAAFEEDSGYKRHTISAFDTPNLEGIDLDMLLAMSDEELNNNVRPYLTTRRWVKDKWISWGSKGDPRWTSRVMGEFPGQHATSLILKSWVDRAFEKKPLSAYGKVYSAGIDVAGSGSDETVAYVRYGGNVVDFDAWPGDDPRDEVEALLMPWHNLGFLTVHVDSNGMGHYFVKHLIDKGFNVVPVNVQMKPNDDVMLDLDEDLPSKRFMNIKAQAYWVLRDQFYNDLIGNVKDPETRDQLGKIRWFEHPQSGKIVIESKDAMKKRGIDSPDRAEAMMLSYCDFVLSTPVLGLAQGVASGWGFAKV